MCVKLDSFPPRGLLIVTASLVCFAGCHADSDPQAPAEKAGETFAVSRTVSTCRVPGVGAHGMLLVPVIDTRFSPDRDFDLDRLSQLSEFIDYFREKLSKESFGRANLQRGDVYPEVVRVHSEAGMSAMEVTFLANDVIQKARPDACPHPENGYCGGTYDFCVYVTGGGGGGGVAGGGLSHILQSSIDEGTAPHELGHLLGMGHTYTLKAANFVEQPGHITIYNHPWDLMGGADSQLDSYSSYWKFHVGWIDDTQVVDVTEPGEYEIWAHNDPLSSERLIALRFPAMVLRDYWVSVQKPRSTDGLIHPRREFETIRDAVIVHSVERSNDVGRYVTEQLLIDTSPFSLQANRGNLSFTNDYQDAPLPMGQPFSFPELGLVIQPVSSRSQAGNVAIKVKVGRLGENVCGNGQLEVGEACDGGQGCGTDCLCEHGTMPTNPWSNRCVSTCGNGWVDRGEQCDGGKGCANDCTCLPGWTQGYWPSPSCQVRAATCGNSTIESGELCDGGVGCTTDCTCAWLFAPANPVGASCRQIATCGNGIIEGPEECDEGTGCLACRCAPGYRVDPWGWQGCQPRDKTFVTATYGTIPGFGYVTGTMGNDDITVNVSNDALTVETLSGSEGKVSYERNRRRTLIVDLNGGHDHMRLSLPDQSHRITETNGALEVLLTEASTAGYQIRIIHAEEILIVRGTEEQHFSFGGDSEDVDQPALPNKRIDSSDVPSAGEESVPGDPDTDLDHDADLTPRENGAVEAHMAGASCRLGRDRSASWILLLLIAAAAALRPKRRRQRRVALVGRRVTLSMCKGGGTFPQ